METVGRSPMMTERQRAFILLAGCCLVLTGCGKEVGKAAPLPPDIRGSTSQYQLKSSDFSAVDLAKSCQDIIDEQVSLKNGIETANATIQSTRSGDQAGGYVAAIVGLGPAVVYSQGHNDERNFVSSADRRLDALNQLAFYKKCTL